MTQKFTGLKSKVIKTDIGFIGKVCAYEKGRVAWSEEYGVTRLAKADALIDALGLKDEMLQTAVGA